MTRFKFSTIVFLALLFCITISAKSQGTSDECVDCEPTKQVENSKPSQKIELAYTTCPHSNFITPIDLKTGRSGIPIALEVCPQGIVIAPSGEKAYIIVDNVKEILSVDLTTGEISNSIALKNVPQQMLVSNDGKTAYVACKDSAEIIAIDLLSEEASVYAVLESSPSRLYFDKDEKKIYVMHEESSTITSLECESKIQTPLYFKEQLQALAVLPQEKLACVGTGCIHEMNVFELSDQQENGGHLSDEKINHFLDKSIQNIHLSPDGSKAYIIHIEDNTITPIDLYHQEIGKNVQLDHDIHSIALYPKQELVAYFDADVNFSNTTCNFDASGTKFFKNPLLQYSWEFGDGISATTEIPFYNHAYDSEGFFDVRLTVTEAMDSYPITDEDEPENTPPLVSTYEKTIEVFPSREARTVFTKGPKYKTDKSFKDITKPLGISRLGGTQPSATTLISSTDPATFGQTILFTATVTTAGTPTGTVIFSDGATQLSTISVDGSGQAVFSTSALSVGSHTITATYSGDETYDVSTSDPLPQSVVAAATTTVVTSTPNPSQFGDTVTFSATVSGGLSTIPTGTVSFSDGATQIGSGTLDSNGIATFSTSLLTVGSHSITAVYSGDTSFDPSTSPTYSQVVNVATTTTALTSSVDPSVFGQPVTFTATVSSSLAAFPTGNVAFSDGATQIGTGTLNGSGVATFTTSALSTGTHSITATYGGDSTFGTSTSAPLTQVNNKALTNTALSATPNPSVFGQSVTLTANISIVSPGAGTVTGTVEFFNGAVSLGTSNVVAGVATFSSAALSVGSHTVTAVYSGDANFTTSTSSPWSQTVTQGTTSTAVTSSQNPAPFGQSLTFTANITVTTGAGAVTGTVTFMDGATVIGTGTVAAGQATLTTSTFAVGTHPVTAIYSGDTNFTTSTSPILSQAIVKGSTATVVTSSANPSTYGQSITLTGTTTVSSGAGTPTGSITFFDGATVLGTTAINGSGVATLSLFNLVLGTHPITATYNGDNNFLTSTSPIVNQVVNQAIPLITLTSSANPSALGNLITFTSTVSAPSTLGLPSGTVTFFDGATMLGTGVLVGSGANTSTTTFSTSALFGGSHSITAVYSGDTNFTTVTSSPPLIQVINQAVSTNTIIFSNSPNPTEFGQVVSLRATITGSVSAPPQAPTGNVVFMDGATVLGTVPITQVLANTSTAALNIATLTTGAHSITAVYQGDVNYPGSTSLPMIQNVIKTGSATVLSTSVTPSKFGQTITITGTVTNNVSGTGNPTGSLQFYDSATLLGSGTLVPSGPNSSVATFTTSALSLGSHTLVGLFNGDANFTSSTSAPLTQVVVQDQTSVSVTSSLNPSTFGSSVTFTANVTANAPGSGTPTGIVEFFDGATSLGIVNLAAGSATLSTIALYPGTHPITAIYRGDTNFTTSTSPVLSQVVTNQLNTVTTITSGRNSSPTGQSVAFSARVTAITGIPTGTVTFSNNGTPFGTGTLVNGVATVTDPGAGLTIVGPYSITAVYNGDPNFITSNSATFTQYVVPLDTSTTLVSTPNPSPQSGSTLTATVTVIGGTGPLTGSVSFFEGTTLIPGTVNFNPVTGVATLSPTNLHFGASPITAVYSGDTTTFARSVSNAITQQVQQTDMLTTNTTLVSSLATAYNCQPVTLTATVTTTQGFYIPTGSVTYFDNNVEIGSALLNSSGVATLTVSNLVVGAHVITATYNSDSNYAFSRSNNINVNIITNTTTTVFTIIPVLSTTPYGQNLIFVAKATSLYSIPTGTMTFSIGANVLATLTLDATGQATLQTSLLPVGTDVLTATYNPTSCFTGSSGTVTHTVSPSNPVTSLTSSPQPSVYGQDVTVTALLSSPTLGDAPTGTVTFFNGSTNLGTVTIVQGAASFNVTGLQAGFQILKAVYSGDSNFTATTLPSINQTVNKAPTSTSLVNFSSNPSASGELVTFEATVVSSAGAPTGTVTFKNGATTLSTVALNGTGSATLQLSTLSLGTNAITATYNGDLNFLTSTSNTYNQVVAKAATTTTITSSTPNPSVFGALVTFNVAVDPVYPASGIATGTVTGYLGSTVLGTSTLTNGAASFTTSSIPVGTQTIRVVYSGDANFNTSNGVATQTVTAATSTTVLASSNNPAVFGQPVTFSATVTSPQGTPTGTVAFVDGTTTLATQTLNSSGIASFTISGLTIGTHPIRAIYSGSANLATSTSAIVNQVINKASTTTVVTSLNNPSFYGKTIVFDAHVSAVSPGAGIPSGTVTFFNGATSIGTGTLDSLGNTSITSTSIVASGAPYAITATYLGNATYNASTSPTFNQTISKTATLTNVTYSPNPSNLAGPVTLNVTVTPINTGTGIPSGNVRVLYGSTVVGSGTLNASGSVAIVSSTLPAGTLGLIVEYAGDSNFLLSSSAITQSVTQNNSTITLTSSANPSVVGQPVTFTTTITVPAGTATGTVAFFDGTTNLGTQTLNTSGTAALTVSGLLLGNHSITAVYSGDTSNAGATSAALNQVVAQASTTTNLSSIPNPTYYGETVTLYAVVNATAPATGIPSGTVTFRKDATVLGTIPVSSNGQALLTISTLAPGANSITATYNGSTNFSTSTSPVTSQVVSLTPTQVTITSQSPNPSALGAAVTVNALVSAVNGFGIPTGTVNAYYGATLVGTGVLDNTGQTTLTLTNLPAGVLGIVLDYLGDANNLASSTPMTQTVSVAASTVTLTSSANPSVIGQPVTFTTTVTSASGTPTGTVSLRDGTTTIATQSLNGAGSATFIISNLALGSHSLTAVYSGNSSNGPATSTVLTQVVNKASTTTTLLSSPNPSFFGEPVVLTALVNATSPATGLPTGNVTFRNGATVLGTTNLNNLGQATLTVSNLPTGSDSLTATYNNDTNFNTSVSATVTQVVNKSATTTTIVSATPNPSNLGAPVTVTVQVAPINTGSGIPTGTVNAFYGSTLVGTGTLNGTGQATLTLTTLPRGSLAIQVTYVGDTNFLTSTTSLTQTVNANTSTTALTSSNNPSVLGQTVTFTATVTATSGTATGTVSFFDGTTSLGTQTLNGSGIAAFNISTLTVGTHAITAVYSGDTNNSGSTSTAVSQVVNAGATTTTLTSLPVNPVFGEPVTLNAFVAATAPAFGIPTGTVTFRDGATVLGTGTLDGSGHATFVTSTLTTGAHSLTATYNTTASFTTSVSPTLALTVSQSATSIVLSSTPNPSSLGSPVTLNVAVAAVSPGAGIPAGTVNALYGSTVVGTGTLDGSGHAAITLTNLPAGTLSIVVNYLGNTNFLPVSGTLSQTVTTSTSTTALTSSVNPTVVGQTTTLTATVTPTTGVATGTVAFFDGTTSLGTQTLNGSGIATLNISTLTVGTHTLTAVYSGDTNNSGSTSPSVSQVVNAGATTTTLTSIPTNPVLGETVTLSSFVSATAPAVGTPTGTVTFRDGATVLGTGTLDGSGHATFVTSTLTQGAHSLTATYNTTPSFTTSVSPTLTLTVGQSATSIALSSTPNPSNVGSPVTLNVAVAAVSPGTGIPTGTVNALYGSTVVGTGTLDGSGHAVLTLTNLPAGTLSIVTNYLGDANFLPVSGTISQTVTASTSTTALVSSVNPTLEGQSTTLTATVTPSAGVATGTITFFDGSTNLGTVALDGAGVASLPISTLTVGTHPITAVYSGSPSVSTSTSNTVNQVVNLAATTTVLTATPNPTVFGTAVLLTANVTSIAPGVGVPEGTVTFSDGATVLGTVIVDNTGTAQWTAPRLTAGTHPLTATYNGNTNFTASTSNTVNEVVNQAPTSTSILSSSPNPSIFGENVSFYAKVLSGGSDIPTGTLTFFDGATPIGTSPVYNGLAIFSINTLSIGSHPITATYSGDTNFLTSTSTPPLVQVVNQVNITVTTTTSLTSSLNPSNFGDSVTFDILVSPIAGGGTPTGVVTLYSGAVPLVTLPLVNAQTSYTTSTLPAGTLQIVALYSGDSNFSSSTMTLAQVVNPITTTTTVTSTLNPSNFGTPVTFNAGVISTTGAIPVGSITFTDGATTLQTVALDPAGNASYTTATLATGPHIITATYNPTTDFLTSNGTVTQVVNLGSTNTSILSSSPNPSTLGETVTFIATTLAPAGGTPTGTLTFFDGATNIGTAPLVGNIAILTTSTLAVGTHSITATYNGSPTYLTSTSLPYSQVVQEPLLSTTTTLSSSLNPSQFGQPVTYTIQVSSTTGIPTGSVTLFDGGSSLTTVVLDAGGFASYTTSSLATGAHSITAVYNGSASYSSSTSAAVNQIVNPSSIPTSPTNFVGVQRANRYLNRTILQNMLSWDPPAGGADVISYKIYRNPELTDLIGTVPATGCLNFTDGNRKKNLNYTYYLVATSPAGDSPAVSVTVYSLKNCGKNRVQ